MGLLDNFAGCFRSPGPTECALDEVESQDSIPRRLSPPETPERNRIVPVASPSQPTGFDVLYFSRRGSVFFGGRSLRKLPDYRKVQKTKDGVRLSDILRAVKKARARLV